MPAPDSRPLVFMHIPKTAGVSVRALIAQNFHRDEIWHVTDPGCLDGQPDPARIASARFIHGHFRYEAMQHLGPRLRKVLFLRDPISRVLSEYRFWRSLDPGLFSHDPEASEQIRLAQSLSFQEFVRCEKVIVRGICRNKQAKFLTAGVHRPWASTEPDRDDRILSLARERVSSFDVVGVTERMRESLALLAQHLKMYPVTSAPVLNASPESPDTSSLDDETRNFLVSENRIDQEIYRYANQLVEERYRRLADRDLAADFENSLSSSNASLPTAVSMEQPLIGYGWHEREGDAQDCWRWTGPGTESCIYLGYRGTLPRELRIHVRHFISRKVLDGIRILVNGNNAGPVRLDDNAGRHVMSLPLQPDQSGSARLVKVLIRCPETLAPSRLDRRNRDQRNLGIAVSRIEIL